MSEMSAGRLLVTLRGLPGSGVTIVLRAAVQEAREQGWSATLIDLSGCDPDTPYAALGRLSNRIPFLVPLAQLLHDDPVPEVVADAMVGMFAAAAEASDVPIMIGLGGIERVDARSSAVLQLVLTNQTLPGAFVLGDLLSRPTKLGSTLTEAVYEDPQARLLVLPSMTASEVAVLVAQCTGKRITHYEAERLRQTTGGRYDVAKAYLSSIDPAAMADSRTLRSLPRMTTGRLNPHKTIDFTELPRMTLLAGELIALHRQGITLQLLTFAAQHLGLSHADADLNDGELVIVDSITGLFELRDPLEAADIVMKMSAERRRALLGVLAAQTHGPESLIHWIGSLGEVSDRDVEVVLAAASSYEASGQRLFAVRALYHAASRASGPAQERLLLAFGFACVRNQVASRFFHAISDVAPLADSSWEFAYIHAYLYAFKPHEPLLAKQMRSAFIAREPATLDHRFLQADIAWLDMMLALKAGEDTEDAWQLVDNLHAQLVDQVPDNPEIRWIHARGRLLQRQAYRRMVRSVELGDALSFDGEVVQRFVEAAEELPPDSVEAANCLTMAAGALLAGGEISTARAVAARARSRVDTLTRTPLLQGRLDVVELEIAIHEGTWDQLHIDDDWTVSDAFDAFDQESQVAWHAMRSWVATVKGDYGAAHRHLTFATISDSAQVAGHAADWLAFARSFLAWQQDGPDAALMVLDFALDEPRNANALQAKLMRLEVLTQTEQADEAESVLADLLVQTAHMQRRLPAFARAAARIEHLRGNYETAVHKLQEVLDLSDSPYYQGLVRLGLSDAFWKLRGGRDNTLESLRIAHEKFEQIGARPFVELVEQLLGSVQAASADRFVQLSTRERQAVMLAGQGWRNKEIAAELGISAATVAFHLSNAFAKLGLKKRSELASLLQQRGLS